MLLDVGKTIVAEAVEQALFSRPMGETVSETERAWEEALVRDGLVVIRGFYDQEKITSLRHEINRLMRERESGVWKDAQGSDHRLFGADRHSRGIKAYLDDPMIHRIGRRFSRTRELTGLTLAAHMIFKKDNQGSGAGWHRDSPISRQFKSILYLSDVDNSNGPFEYLLGSHRKSSVVRLVLAKHQTYRQFRFADESVEQILMNVDCPKVRFLGKAGDLALVNTKGIHRGSPMQQGERYALTNYYFRGPIPEHFNELLAKNA